MEMLETGEIITYWLPVNNPEGYLGECTREEWEAYVPQINIIEDGETGD